MPDHSYLLRMWRERSQAPWRVTLFAVAQSDQRRQFDMLEDCFAYVRQQAAAPNEPSAHLNETLL
jgi:hypothetical protein